MFGVRQSRGHTPGAGVQGREQPGEFGFEQVLPAGRGGLGPLPPTCLSGEGRGRGLAGFLCLSPRNARNARDLSG